MNTPDSFDVQTLQHVGQVRAEQRFQDEITHTREQLRNHLIAQVCRAESTLVLKVDESFTPPLPPFYWDTSWRALDWLIEHELLPEGYSFEKTGGPRIVKSWKDALYNFFNLASVRYHIGMPK